MELFPLVREGEFRHNGGIADKLDKPGAIDAFGTKYLLGIFDTSAEVEVFRWVEHEVREGPRGCSTFSSLSARLGCLTMSLAVLGFNEMLYC